MQEVIPGILHWQAPHPRIGVDVSSYLLTDSGTLLDPQLPEGESPAWIGQRVQRVVLTIHHHLRSAAAFGVPVFVHASGAEEIAGDNVDLRTFEAGDELAPDVRALGFGRIAPDDVVLRIGAGEGALAFGDGVINYGELGHPPDQYIGEDPEAIRASILAGLPQLLGERFDTLLFAHGAPVASGGKELLRQFVESRHGGNAA